MCFLCTVYVRIQCSVLLYSLLYKYCCTAVWRPPPPPQCSYCSRHRLSGRRSYMHPQFTAQLVGACSYWHLGTEHVFLWPCAYYYYFLRLKFLTTKFLTGDAVCNHQTLYARCNTRVQFVLDVATKLCTLDVILEYSKTRIREEKTSTEHTRRKAAPFRLR